VNQSRGNRSGNQAFIEEQADEEENTNVFTESAVLSIVKTKDLELGFLQKLMVKDLKLNNDLIQ
jgi:hypothetical protein